MAEIVENKQTHEKALAITNVSSAVKKAIEGINRYSLVVLNRNAKKADKDNAEASRRKALEALVDLVASGITLNQIQNDKWGVLKASMSGMHDQPKVNAILRQILEDKTKGQADKLLTDVEIAKLIETPNMKLVDPKDFVKVDVESLSRTPTEVPNESVPTPDDDVVVEVKTNNPTDESVIIDKANGIAYLMKNGQYYAKTLQGLSKSWFETAKEILTNVFGFIWAKTLEFFKWLLTSTLKILDGLLGVATKTVEISYDTSSSIGRSFLDLFKSKPKDDKEVPSV